MAIKHPALPLQKAIFDTLKADPEVTALVGDRIYDQVPQDTAYPYLVISGGSFFRDQWMFDCTALVLCVTKSVGVKDAKALGGLVQGALDIEIEVEGFITQEWTWEAMDLLVDTEDETQVAEVEMNYLLDPDTD